jgi:hypothetical protein
VPYAHRARKLLLPVALLGVSLGGCDCADGVSSLPEPAAVLHHVDESTPPLDRLDVDTGAVDLAAEAIVDFTLANEGTARLQVHGAALIADEELCPRRSDAFVLSSGAGMARQLDAGETFDLQVTFEPDTGAPACAVLAVDTNDERHPRLLALIEGQGDAARLCATPYGVDLGEVVIGERADDVVRLESCGTRPITLTSLGTNEQFPPFEVDAGALPLELLPGDGVDVAVAFAPTVPGPYRAATNTAGVVDLVTDDASAFYQLFLEGTARTPPSCELQVIPGQLSFGAVYEGREARQDLVLRNIGELDCAVDTLAVREPTGSFSVDLLGQALPLSLEPLASTTVQVTFAPPSPTGSENAFLEVRSDDPLRPSQEVPLAGTGLETQPCMLEAAPSPASFGNQQLGDDVVQEITLTSVGTQTCTVTRVELTSQTDAAFYLEPPGLPMLMPVNSTRTLKVHFRPLSPGPAAGAVELYAGLLPLTPDLAVSLSGNGTGARLCPAPDPVAFGSHPVGAVVDKTLNLVNCGSEPLDVNDLSLEAGTPSAFSLIGVTPSAPIAPGSSVGVALRFDASSEGAFEGFVLLESNDALEPLQRVRLVASSSSTACGDITGTICGLAGTGPLAGGAVFVDTGAGRVETTTDDNGRFVLPCVPAGQHTVTAESGNWDVSFDATVDDYQVTVVAEEQCLDPDSARIAVVEGEWDNMGTVITDLGLDYEGFAEDSFDSTEDLLGDWGTLSSFDIVFLNCGFDEHTALKPQNLQNLRDFVAQGGSVYGSDWSYDVVEEGWPSFVDFHGDDNNPGAAESAGNYTGIAAVLDDTLVQMLNGRDRVPITSCCTAIEAAGPGFEPAMGSGRVFYTDFHNSEQQDIDRIFVWLLQQL